jgi:hypothetical protein
MGPGGNNVRRSSLLGGQLCGAGLDLHDTFWRGRCVFAKKDHRGNWRELKIRSIIILGLQTILLLQKSKWNQKRIQWSQKEERWADGNTSSSRTSYSARICYSIGPRALQKTWVFHINHQSSKPTAEEMKTRSTGIGMKRSENRL